MAEYILSADRGTTRCKTVLFNTDFNVVATAKTSYDTGDPHQGRAEQPACQWWRTLKDNTREMLETSSIDPARIIANDVEEMIISRRQDWRGIFALACNMTK